MKRLYAFITVVAIAISMMVCFAAAEAEEPFRAELPILITSCGRSNDFQIVAKTMEKQKMEFTLNADAAEADLEGINTLIIVVGGSSKGLGAAGIDADGELDRVTKLLDAAKEKEITVIIMHTGGTARRGTLSDKFIEPVFPYADYAIVLADGDEDGLMQGICDENGIPLVMIEKLKELVDIMPELFS